MKDNYESQKKVILDNVGKIDRIEQVEKAIQFIIDKRSPSYSGILRSTVKALWWECHEYNKNNWSDLEWTFKNNSIESHKGVYTGDDISDSDLNELLNLCKSEKQKMFIKFLSITGLRISEMTGILISDCRTLDGKIEININAKKSGLPLCKIISSDIYKNINHLFNGKKYLFETSGGKSYRPEYISNQIKKLGHEMQPQIISKSEIRKMDKKEKVIAIRRNGKNISAVTMRRYFATKMVNNGNISTVSKEMGHKINKGFMDYYGGILV